MPLAHRPTLLMAADVFGFTPELARLAEDLDARAVILSPHGPEAPAFRTETEAYAAFQASASIPAYAHKIRSALAASPRPFDLALGFSVGATALWLCLAQTAPWLPRQAILYYGSRIRQHAELAPQCPTRLVFAAAEASFDPAELAKRLRGQGRNAKVIPGSAHGFMNPLSPGYNPQLAAREILQIKSLLG